MVRRRRLAAPNEEGPRRSVLWDEPASCGHVAATFSGVSTQVLRLGEVGRAGISSYLARKYGR